VSQLEAGDVFPELVTDGSRREAEGMSPELVMDGSLQAVSLMFLVEELVSQKSLEGFPTLEVALDVSLRAASQR
jgi:hypothetical protein